VRGQHGVVGGKHQRAGGPRGVVEQRLVPARRRIVGVDRDRGGLDRREAIMVVERMKEGQMQTVGRNERSALRRSKRPGGMRFAYSAPTRSIGARGASRYPNSRFICCLNVR
jgi:hypothetical protein